MKRQAKKPTPKFDRYKVLKEVLICAYKKQATFTSHALANRAKCSDTRHFRAYLMQLVREGILIRQRVLFSDGRYRYVFCGQLTRELPFMYTPNEIEKA